MVATSPARFPVLGRFFLRDAPPLVTRSAVAVVDPRVSFALSNCLLSLRLLNGLLEPLLGADMDLLCSGHGLRINAVSLMNQLALRGELLAPDTTYGDILDAELPLIDILEAAYGQTGLAAELAAPVFASERLRLALKASKLYKDIEARTPGAARRKAIRKLDLRSKIYALLAGIVFFTDEHKELSFEERVAQGRPGRLVPRQRPHAEPRARRGRVAGAHGAHLQPGSCGGPSRSVFMTLYSV